MAFSYVALDVETSGIHNGVLLSIGMVIDRIGSAMLVEDLPTLNIIVGYNTPVHGDPVAIGMNNALLHRIYAKTPIGTEQLVAPDDIFEAVTAFLRKHKTVGADHVLAGKNPAFDARWLSTLVPGIKWHRRTIDPTILYLRPSDILPPNLATCLERAGIEQHIEHNALDDAQAIVKLIRSYFEDKNT